MLEYWFQVPIFFKDLDNITFHQELDSAISNVEIKLADKMWNDNVQTSFSYSSKNQILDQCPKLNLTINDNIIEYLSIFDYKYSNKICITESWINIITITPEMIYQACFITNQQG
jgi:hypothetical protein